ncbi:MAG: hypothetical protein WD045_08575 [Pirellulaceae bacterium]
MNIPSQYHAILEQAVASGAFPSAEEALRHALELLATEQRLTSSSVVAANPPSDRSRRFRNWAESHPPAKHSVDDRRESIY